MLLKLDCIDDLLNPTALLNGLADSAHMTCTPTMFSLTVSHHSPRFIVTLQMIPKFFTSFSNDQILHSRIPLRPFYTIIIDMQRSYYSSMKLHFDPRPNRLILLFWNPRDEQRLFLRRLTLLAPSVEEDVGQIDLGTFVSMDSQVFQRIVTEFNGYLVRITLTNSHVKFYIGTKEIILTKEERQCIIEDITRGEETEFLIALHPIAIFYNISLQSKRIWFFKTTNSCCMIVAPIGMFAQFKIYFPDM